MRHLQEYRVRNTGLSAAVARDVPDSTTREVYAAGRKWAVTHRSSPASRVFRVIWAYSGLKGTPRVPKDEA